MTHKPAVCTWTRSADLIQWDQAQAGPSAPRLCLIADHLSPAPPSSADTLNVSKQQGKRQRCPREEAVGWGLYPQQILEGVEVAALQGGCLWLCSCHRSLFKGQETSAPVLPVLGSYLMCILLIFLFCRTTKECSVHKPPCTPCVALQASQHFNFPLLRILPAITSPFKIKEHYIYPAPSFMQKAAFRWNCFPWQASVQNPSWARLAFPLC